jgi:putative SOS response-associated peptidase YedK
MCGRFVASRPISDIVDVFEVDDVEVPEELTRPRWNVAPQAGVLAVTLRRPRPARDSAGGQDSGAGSGDSRHEGPDAMEADRSGASTPPAPEDEPLHRRLTSYRWGLVPSWAKDPSFGARAFNARAESLLDKSAFRNAVGRRRCLIPADAFYEWEKPAGGAAKGRGRRALKPWCYRSPDGGPLAFAGLWEAWKASPAGSPDSQGSSPGAHPLDGEDPAATGWHDAWLLSCTIITTPANETVSPVHDRMPLVLHPDDWETWLRPGPLAAEELTAVLTTPPVGLLEAYEVSSEVNASSAEGPQLVSPLAEAADGHDAAEQTLF